MKATEILDKFKNILLSEDGEVSFKQSEEIQAVNEEAPAVEEEQVELASEEVEKEELAEQPMQEDEASPEDSMEDKAEGEDKYATKEELAKALAEMKAMYDALMSSMDKKQEMEVPTELSADEAPVVSEPAVEQPQAEAAPQEQAEAEVEVSSAEPLTHSPEAKVDERPLSLYAQRGAKTTTDSVFNKLFK